LQLPRVRSLGSLDAGQRRRQPAVKQTAAIVGIRLGEALLTAFLAFVMVFSLLHLVPGDPVELMLGEQARPAQREALRAALGLDRPLTVQFREQFLGLLQGDLGTSIHYRKPVSALIAERVGPTLALALAAMAVALLLAVPLGVAAGWRPGARIDRAGRILAVLGISMPNVWLGPLLLLAFALWWPLFPVGGYTSYSALVLPALTLGTALAAMLTRMLRASVAETRDAMFVTAARAKGASERRLLWRHALRPALIPVVTIAGLQLGALLSGAIITETIFQWPGLGRLLIEAVQARDYPLVQGVVLILTFIYIAVNTGVDLLYVWIDPRAREQAHA